MKIVRHDTGISPDGTHSGGISLKPLCGFLPPLVVLDPSDFETTGPLECSECSHECSGHFGIITVGICSITSVKWLEGYI